MEKDEEISVPPSQDVMECDLVEDAIVAPGRTRFLAAAPRLEVALRQVARESEFAMAPITAVENRAARGEYGYRGCYPPPWTPQEQREVDALREVIRLTIDVLGNFGRFGRFRYTDKDEKR